MKDDTTNAPTKLHQCDWKFLTTDFKTHLSSSQLVVKDHDVYASAKYVLELGENNHEHNFIDLAVALGNPLYSPSWWRTEH